MTSAPTSPDARALDRLGPAYEAGLDPAHRHAIGAFYTPSSVAERLVGLAARGVDLAPPRRPTVCDPAVGGGVFLLAAARRLAANGHDRATVVADLVWGTDIDPEAVAVTRATLEGWAAEGGVRAEARHVVVADSLAVGPAAWPDRPATGFDLVVGNPPFQSQLGRDTARRPAQLARLRARLGPVVTPYVDSAALFLVEACRAVAPGGRVALIVPQAVLATRDAEPARAEVLEGCALVGLWWAGDAFEAAVDVCAPILVRGAKAATAIERWRGHAFTSAEPASVDAADLAAGRPWSRLLAEPGAPIAPSVDARRRLGSIAAATAGFRDEFYGVVPFVSDGDPDASIGPTEARLVTAGLIDPLHCRWGATSTRFASRRWGAPVVDLAALDRDDPRLARWAHARLVPKVVLATQTRVLEPAIDLDGTWWPSVPTIAITPRLDWSDGSVGGLWSIAAVVAAPPVSAWALDLCRGSALSRDAIKLSATQVLELPLPFDDEAWLQGATHAAEAHDAAVRSDGEGWSAALDRLGQAMTEAYGADLSVFEWWRQRRPTWR